MPDVIEEESLCEVVMGNEVKGRVYLTKGQRAWKPEGVKLYLVGNREYRFTLT